MPDTSINLQDFSKTPPRVKDLFSDIVDGSPDYGDSALRLMQGAFGGRNRRSRVEELQTLDLERRLKT